MNDGHIELKNRRIGYARVSTSEQDLDLQIDALLRFGVAASDIFTDKIS
ncbi:MAG: recombinase family protein, partial [Planctomycetaceae bacterium]|nr:recombinase family protein [Planctomycetaceae bacterium]